jgi:hypothetical protein
VQCLFVVQEESMFRFDETRATQGDLSAEMFFQGDEVPGLESQKAITGIRRGSSGNRD